MNAKKPLSLEEKYERAKAHWIECIKAQSDARYRVENAVRIMDAASAEMMRDLQARVAAKESR